MTRVRYKGFTLAEVLVASTISGFIAIVAVGTLNAVSNTATTVNRVSEVNAEIRFAARMLARDLANLYRDPNPENVKLIGASQGSETTGPPFLTFYTVGRAKARADQPEGDVYEVEYILGTRQGDEQSHERIGRGVAGALSPLWPNPDKDREPRGILTPIAENIGVFYIRFFDGQEWAGEWTEEMRTLPELIEVTLGTAPPEKGDPVLETFTITFPRMAEAEAGGPQQGESSEGGEGQQEQTESSSESSAEQGSSARAAARARIRTRGSRTIKATRDSARDGGVDSHGHGQRQQGNGLDRGALDGRRDDGHCRGGRPDQPAEHEDGHGGHGRGPVQMGLPRRHGECDWAPQRGSQGQRLPVGPLERQRRGFQRRRDGAVPVQRPGDRRGGQAEHQHCHEGSAHGPALHGGGDCGGHHRLARRRRRAPGPGGGGGVLREPAHRLQDSQRAAQDGSGTAPGQGRHRGAALRGGHESQRPARLQ